MSKIAFLHPDLGIGGAERLVVDAAMGLQEKNKVCIYTSHCDMNHCFEEISNKSLPVKVYGDFLPTHIVGRFHILFAILRQLYLTIMLILTGEIVQFDYFIVDQLSICIPLIQLFARKDAKVLFYCHFPDQLLAKRGSAIKSLYRYPFDKLEEWTTGLSDRIVVNSNFTKSVFHKTFKNLTSIEPGVVYPCVDVHTEQASNSAKNEVADFFKDNQYFLSINRFERKKNVELAIKAFAQFKEKTDANKKIKLVIAGGFDPRVAENVQYLHELSHLAESLQLKAFTIRGKLLTLPPSTDVLFLPSVKSSIKSVLIEQSLMLLYTPSFEHFGIVPVESMLNKTAVLAVNNGGPLESVIDLNQDPERGTGYICEANAELWSQILVQHYSLSQERKLKIGQNGFERAVKIFSREEMTKSFQKNLETSEKTNKGIIFKMLQMWKFHLLGFVIVCLAIIQKNSYQTK